jgi:hypothetical protein
MKRAIYIKYLLSLIIIVSCLACNQNKEKLSNASCKKTDLNPNGDSELALLMRAMTAHTDSNATLLRAGSLPINYPDLKKILTATPTDSSLDRTVFNGFAGSYLQAIDAFNAASTSEKIKAHNQILQNCQSCHEQFCRGPLKKIAKMKI